ncbi:MAG: hypothetical protein E7D41_00665 [Cutibacterium sp.]|nr:hypothetical protein [Cutibacterium sp.]
MVQDLSTVRIGSPKAVGGYAATAPMDTKRPTKAPDPLTGYTKLGYISDDGVSIKTDFGTDKIKDWNLDTVAVVQKNSEASIEVTFISTDPETCRALFGDDGQVTISNGHVINISIDGHIMPHRRWAFLLSDGQGEGILDIGDGQVTGVDGLEFKKDQVVGFKTTIELFKDEKGNFLNWLMVPPVAPSPSGSGS